MQYQNHHFVSPTEAILKKDEKEQTSSASTDIHLAYANDITLTIVSRLYGKMLLLIFRRQALQRFLSWNVVSLPVKFASNFYYLRMQRVLIRFKFNLNFFITSITQGMHRC